MKGEQTVAGLMPSSSNARQISNLTAQICETHSTAYSSKGNHCRFPPACYEQRCQLCLNDYGKIIVFAQWKKLNETSRGSHTKACICSVKQSKETAGAALQSGCIRDDKSRRLTKSLN